jgi:hypothetical protein
MAVSFGFNKWRHEKTRIVHEGHQEHEGKAKKKGKCRARSISLSLRVLGVLRGEFASAPNLTYLCDEVQHG